MISFYLTFLIDWFWLINILSIKTIHLELRMWTVNVFFNVHLDGVIDEYEWMLIAHMFLFNWALLDAEGLGDSVGLLQLQLLLLGIWQDSFETISFWTASRGFFSKLACKEIPRELLWPPDKEDTEFLITLGMEVLAWSLRVAILACPPPSL